MIMITFLLFAVSAVAVTPSAPEPSLAEFLTKAWETSPLVAGVNYKREEAEQRISSARGGYFPHLSLEAIDTTGFAASNSDLRIGGLMGSPFRKGWAGGVVLDQIIYDFGRVSSALEQAKAERSLSEARLAQEKLHYLTALGDLYLACAKVRSLARLNEALVFWAKLLLTETTRFAKTGQRSVIDRSLVQSEIMDLELKRDDLMKQETTLLAQMKTYTPTAGCQHLSESLSAGVRDDLRVGDPEVLIARAEIELSRAALDNAKAAQLPQLKVTGSLGEMEDVRLVQKEDYAAGVGLVFPIWNGGEDAHRESAATSRLSYQNEALKAEEMDFTVLMKGLRDSVARNRTSLKGIDDNLDHVRETMKLATKRYQRLEGPLIDVREAYRQLQNVEFERIRLMEALAAGSLQLSLLK